MRLFQEFEKLVIKINETMMWFSGFLIVLMGLTTTYDVFMRSVFNMPTQWAFELNSYLCVAVAFLAGGFTLMVNGHVSVDIFYLRFKPRNKALVNICTSGLIFLLCAVLIIIGSQTVIESWQQGAHSGGGLNPPLFIPQLLVPLGGILLGLQAIIRFGYDLRLASKSKKGEK